MINIPHKVSLSIVLSVKRCVAFMGVAGPIKPCNRLMMKFHTEKHYLVKAPCRVTPFYPLKASLLPAAAPCRCGTL